MVRRNKKNQSYLYIWFIVVLITVAVIFATVYFYRSLQEQLFSERQSHLTEMTVKISEVIDVTIETMQEKADAAGKFIDYNPVTEEKLSESLSELSDSLALTNEILFAIDEEGRYYNSEGKSGRWGTMEDLVSASTVPVIRDLTIAGEKQSCMVFFSRLVGRGQAVEGGASLFEVAVAFPLSNIEEYLSISMFDDSCYTYLVNSQGRRLYKQTFSSDFIEDINVLSALRENKFIKGGSYEDLVESVKQRQTSCIEFRESDSGENFFVSTVPVTGSDWTVLLFVPTQVLGVQTNQFMHTVLLYFSGIAIAGILFFVSLIYMVLTGNNDRKMIAQQIQNNRMLEAAAEEARSANAAKSEFLAHMSHDIRTPINGILGMTSIAMRNRGDQERIDDCLNKINGAAEHLLTLVNDVLDMSAIENKKVVVTHEPLDIRTLLNNCTSIVEGQLMTRKIDLRKEFGDFQYPYVYGDELHMRQVFINILSNAVKFTPDGGSIVFRVKEEPLSDKQVHYRFEVEDTGIGISEEFQSKIFDAFSQADKGGRTTYQGTGLGMAISKRFVDMMNGTISVKSKLGEGSCFTVDLTLDIDASKHETAVASKEVHLDGMKVLVVEDNELNMEIACDILGEEKMEITTAENGKEAVDIFEAEDPGRFDVILMDIMMPVMNGYDATRAIRASAHEDAKTIPIIAMTANAYREDVEKSLSAGMNAHIAKPIDVPLLLSVLAEYRQPA